MPNWLPTFDSQMCEPYERGAYRRRIEIPIYCCYKIKIVKPNAVDISMLGKIYNCIMSYKS